MDYTGMNIEEIMMEMDIQDENKNCWWSMDEKTYDYNIIEPTFVEKITKPIITKTKKYTYELWDSLKEIDTIVYRNSIIEEKNDYGKFVENNIISYGLELAIAGNLGSVIGCFYLLGGFQGTMKILKNTAEITVNIVKEYSSLFGKMKNYINSFF